MLDYWDVLVVALVGGLFCVNPRRYSSLYRALGAYALCALAVGTGYLFVTRPAGDWIAGVLG
ncbi:hypothetical protein ABTY98_05225 [Streptomyces sp. NPDC096040]|uniref:hypothetical protein n=1 Tax=Streptomyces sp. NPDC096040 TaxID=3155541 RepID=UPI003320F1FF